MTTAARAAAAAPRRAPRAVLGGTTTSGGEGGEESCEPAGGSFECGVTSCLTNTQFCVLGDPGLGDTCKAIGGSSCPDCDAVLSLYDCGEFDTICDGDETTGVTIICE